MLKRINTKHGQNLFKYFLFWLLVYAYHIITVNPNNYSNLIHLLESKLVITVIQAIVASGMFFFLIPKLLNKKKNISFLAFLALLLLCVIALYHTSRVYYFEIVYPEPFSKYFKFHGHESVLERLLSLATTFSKTVYFLSPTLLLLLFRFYKNQQRLLKLNEQKKTAELSALKHQLNPHFLFNTLNNLYALALKKSDKTPEVISKLSDILDYMLYRCNDSFTSLRKEVELIENYLILEKIRYGKRVRITFDAELSQEVKIAPLVLLTFIENAFKHGVSQELKEAFVKIKISTKGSKIEFTIKNSIAKENEENSKAIGLKNIKKQLELLYSNEFDLDISEEDNIYIVHLSLEAK